MKKRIVVEYGKISQISKDFKVTRQAVYKALNYLSNSSKATLIRKVAIERGGVEIGDQKETGMKGCFCSFWEMSLKSISL